MNRNFITDAIAKPGEHPRVYIFVITYGFAIATSGLSTLILDNLGTWVQANTGLNKLSWQIAVVAGISALVAFALSSIPQVLRGLFRRAFPLKEEVYTNVIPITETEQPTYPGLIAFMSRNLNSPAEVCIKHHWANGSGRLKYCWLVGTDLTEDATQDMIQRLKEQGIPIQVIDHPAFCPITQEPRQVYLLCGKGYQLPRGNHQSSYSLHLTDEIADDPNKIRALIDQIYLDAGVKSLGEEQLIADYTGGTKSMTAGVVLACATPNRRVQYLSQLKKDIQEVRISYRLIKGR